MKLNSNTLIAIPVKNGEGYIERTLKSCVSQTTPTTILVVDNCSTDRTIDICKKFQRTHKNIKIVRNKKDLGRIGNWNRCLELFEKTKYKYIKFVFSGDEILPDCVKEVEKVFSKDKNIGAVSFLYEFIDLNGRVTVTKEKYNKTRLLDVKEINYLNYAEGGILGAIICDTYSKKAINGYRFNEIFLGKADFDYKVLSCHKAYFLHKVLARFHLDAHGTFFKSLDYLSETEFTFNRAYHLEKNKHLFNKQEYSHIRERIFIDFVARNLNYYSLSVLIRIFWAVLLKLPDALIFRAGRLGGKIKRGIFKT